MFLNHNDLGDFPGFSEESWSVSSDLQISLPLHTAHSASALCSTLALVLNDLVYGYLSTHVYLLYVISDIKQ